MEMNEYKSVRVLVSSRNMSLNYNGN